MQPYLVVREAAQLARLSPYRLRQLLHAKRLEGVRIAGTGGWRIKRSSLEKFLESQNEQPAQK